MKVKEISQIAKEAHKVRSSVERDLFFENLIASARKLLRVPFAGLWISDPQRGSVRKLFPRPESVGEEAQYAVLDALSVVGEIVNCRRPFHSADIHARANWRRKAWSEERGLTTYAGVPVLIERKAVGVLSALDKRPRVFSSRDLEVLSELSSIAADVLRRSRPDLAPETAHSNCQLCFVREASVFSCLDEDRLQEFERLKRVAAYAGEAVIFHEGSEAAGLHVICGGRVKLVKADEEGRSVVIRIANPGELLGKTALFTGRRYMATAIALGEARVAYLPKEQFFSFLGEDCALFQAMNRSLSVEVEELYRRLFKGAFNDNKRRLAAHILSLRETYGHETPEGVLLDLKLRQEDLAEMIGTSTRTVIRMMNLFRKEGILKTARGKITILDEPQLLSYAGEIF